MLPLRALLIAALLPLPQPDPATAPLCAEWRECRQQAVDAADRGSYQRFHDLAWRAVQTGPPHQPDLMLLLARAQALSGRAHDALVMIQRLADMGVAVDASGDEFEPTRALPDWPAVAARLARHLTATTPAEAARPKDRPEPARVDVVAPAARDHDSMLRPTSRSPASQPAPRSVAAEFAVPRLRAGGLAFDAVSQRFVVGDAADRKLLVVGVGGTTSTDMVRADSAGFDDVAAVAIDTTRGDLWVAGAGGAVHRLQLVSGRPLRTYRAAPATSAARIVDLAVGPAGTIVALDAAENRLLSLGRGATELRSVMVLGVSGVTSLVLEDEGTALVAHATGIVRADLRTHATVAVPAAEGIDLRGIEQLRAHRGSWVGLQRDADTVRVVRLTVSGSGSRRVSASTIIDADGPVPTELTGRAFLTVSGDELYYLTATSKTATSDALPLVIRRLRLR